MLDVEVEKHVFTNIPSRARCVENLNSTRDLLMKYSLLLRSVRCCRDLYTHYSLVKKTHLSRAFP